MLAIAKRESKLFPYAVSSADARGLFQLKEIAVSHVNKKFEKEFTDRFDINQNIEIALLYFQIIKAKYKNKDNFWERCLAAWNRGMERVDADEVFAMGKQPIATQQFIREVFRIWNNCKKTFKNNGKILLFLLLLFGSAFGLAAFFTYDHFFFKQPFSIPGKYAEYTVLSEEEVDMNKDGQNEKIVIISNIPTEFTFGVTKMLLIKRDGSFVEISEDGSELQWWRIGDFNKNGKMDIAVLYGYRGSAGFGQFYLHEWSDDGFVALFAKEDISNEVVFEDLDNDGLQEIIYSFQPLKWSKMQREIYKWDKKSSAYIKIG
jgi:hypothetical protein